MTEPVFRPLVQHGAARAPGAVDLAGGPYWFTHVEALGRQGSRVLSARDVPSVQLERLSAPRAPIAGLDLSQPRLMGILNVTPDSFSDGGQYQEPARAVARARAMASAGADMLDIGGESTRPGAITVAPEDEIARTAPVIRAIRAHQNVPLSIDTRKASVARAALAAGANLVNDVSGLTYDPALTALCAAQQVPVCIMHSKGEPAAMQRGPDYDNVVLDVYQTLDARVSAAEAAGIPRHQILIDPGIGFGKTMEHNLVLLRNLSAFHALGCAILVGASRKRFIGRLGATPRARDRMPGSIAVGLAALAQGVQLLRVHDVAETWQGLALWQAARAE